MMNIKKNIAKMLIRVFIEILRLELFLEIYSFILWKSMKVSAKYVLSFRVNRGAPVK